MTRLEIGFITEADYEAEEHEEHAIIRSSGVDKYSFLYSIPHSDGGTYIKTAEYNKEQLMVWFRGTMRLAMIALNPYKAFEFNMPIVPGFTIPTDKLAKEDELYSLVDLFSHQLDFLNVEGPAPILQAAAAVPVAAPVQEDPSGSGSSSSSSQDDPELLCEQITACGAVADPAMEGPSVPVESVPVESPSVSEVPSPSVSVVPVPGALDGTSVSEDSVSASVSEDSASVSVVPVESVSEERLIPSPRRSLRLKANEQK